MVKVLFQLYRSLGNFNGSSSQCVRHFLNFRKCKPLLNRVNVLKWNEISVSLIVSIIWEFYDFLSFSGYWFWKKIEIPFTCRIYFRFLQKQTLYFVLFYQKIINSTSSNSTRILLLRIKYRLPPNPPMYMMNKISYLWRLKISSSSSTFMTSDPFWNSESKTPWWKWGTSAWAYREDRECFEIDCGSSSDWSWQQSVCRQWV